MSVLDKKTAVDLTKLLIFIVVTTVATSVLVVTIGNISFAGSKEYKAEFVDATGVVKGDDIRVAGVKVGTVQGRRDRRPHPRPGHVLGRGSTPITGATNAAIRYRNLVGQRYITLTQEIGDSARLDDGRDDPGLADLARARPDRALQRLQAALPGAVARRPEQAVATRSSRSSRARAAPSRACSPTPRRSPRPSPRATRSSAS